MRQVQFPDSYSEAGPSRFANFDDSNSSRFAPRNGPCRSDTEIHSYRSGPEYGSTELSCYTGTLDNCHSRLSPSLGIPDAVNNELIELHKDNTLLKGQLIESRQV